MKRKELGDWGEKKALEYLENKNYIILARKFRCCFGEIDLIAIDEDYLVFIEVKTRRSKKFGPPEAAVDYHKQQKIKKLANYYLLNNDYNGFKVRFDVIAIYINEKKGQLRHLINSF